MKDYKNEILETIKDLNLNETIPLSDIPKIYLYMDQVITLFENALSKTKRNKDDKILTKTMINNYTKDKLLMPADKKKYSTDHIIMMILIYNLKQILSINDIKLLLNKLVEKFNTDKDNIDLENFYKHFLHIQNVETNNFYKTIEDKLNFILDDNFNIDDDEDYSKLVIIILTLVYNANMYKRLAENLIDKYCC
ncbi:DUF1836 domain-containing protein [Clostridium cochlearium]|uniref:DUF1836 domain-containing protein n=1 Tax=Clostridium cochlearium TaxID=1494 RepID=UPI000BBC09CD|nr:DUF1836 domain-containing protein [Clostridium cochlearium]MBU5269411.1 DUF1836 domain-containing protein [Clostridium cochlearium]